MSPVNGYQGEEISTSLSTSSQEADRIKVPELNYLIYLPIPTLSQGQLSDRSSLLQCLLVIHEKQHIQNNYKREQRTHQKPPHPLAWKRWPKPAACEFPAHKHCMTEDSSSSVATHTLSILPCPRFDAHSTQSLQSSNGS